MAYSYVEHVGTAGGTTGPFSYGPVALLDASVESIATQLNVFKNGTLLVITTDYTINTTAKTITLTASAFANDTVRIARNTKKNSRYVDYVDSTNVTSELLDLDSNQLFYTMQEAYDVKNDAIVKDVDGKWDARSLSIKNVSSGVYGTDAVNVNQLNAAVTGGLPANLQGYGVEVYKGDGTNKTFKLPLEILNVASADDFEVHVDGTRLTPREDYEISGADFVLDASVSAPGAGVDVLVTYPRGAVSAILTANSVFTDSLQPKCVTVSKINNGTSGQFLKTSSGLITQWASIVAADVTNLDTTIKGYKLSDLQAATAALDIGSNKLTNVASPTTTFDAANKKYIDDLLADVVAVADFTPVLQFGGASAGITYATGGQKGRAVKIGKLVHVSVYIKLSNAGSSTGAASIAGLPFNVDSGIGTQPLSWNPVAINTGNQIYAVTGSTNQINLRYQSTGTTFTDLTKSQFTNSSEFHIAGTYISA